MAYIPKNYKVYIFSIPSASDFMVYKPQLIHALKPKGDKKEDQDKNRHTDGKSNHIYEAVDEVFFYVPD